MSQTLERAGDHAKNLAEETCHLVTGRSVRPVLREYDRSFEQGFVDRLRRTIVPRSLHTQFCWLDARFPH